MEMKPRKNELTFIQKIRRLNQKHKLFGDTFDVQNNQFIIAQKLYRKNGLELVLTCGMCPEQYDVKNYGVIVAYYRLRHGVFTIDCPDAGGEEILSLQPNGEGVFEKEERLNYLALALRKVKEYYKERNEANQIT